MISGETQNKQREREDILGNIPDSTVTDEKNSRLSVEKHNKP
jgi:hypothetical protein